MAPKQTLNTFIISLFLPLLFSFTHSRPLDDELAMLKRHEDWMVEHGRVYPNVHEKDERYVIFRRNVQRIENLNNVPERKFKLGVNKFADLTNEEFRDIYTGFKRNMSETMPQSKKTTSLGHGNVPLEGLPNSIDWRKKGAVTPIKNQDRCECCWAFSAVAAIEGITQIKKGKLISLSEQQLVDCDGRNYGCEGGLVDVAFRFVKSNGGLTTEDNYPYKGLDGTCNSKRAGATAAAITGYKDVPANDEDALMQAVAKQPVSVAIEGSGFDFQFYSSGIFAGDCGKNLDHAVAAVGYGEDHDGTKYWIIKNSWGKQWGEKGYMKIQRNVKDQKGLCGLAMKASYPIM